MNTYDIPFSILSIESALDLATRCSATIREKHPKNNSFKSTLARLDDARQEATIAIAGNRKKALTEAVQMADKKRDRLFIGFRKMVESFQYFEPDESIMNAAEVVLQIIRTHGTQLHLKTMSKQSSLLASLFQDLAAADAKAAVNKLGLTNWLNSLKQAQNEFIELLQKRSELEARKDIYTKKEAYTRLIDKLSTLLKGLDFLSSVDPETYGETVRLVTEISDQIITSERLGHKDTEAPVEETSESAAA